jgi:hypothetical protein
MKRAFESLKRLLFAVARSSALNWILFILILIGVTFNLYSTIVYKILVVLLSLEIVILNANTYKLEDLLAPKENELTQEEEY